MSVFTNHYEPWTASDVWGLYEAEDAPDGVRFEAIDGILLVSPPPPVHHQAVLTRLSRVMHRELPADLDWLQGVGVEIGSGLLIPDLVVVAVPVMKQFDRGLRPSQVVLAVEVESPTGLRRDRVLKTNAYAEAGIPNYWRVEMTDPADPVVVMSRLQDGVYVAGAPVEFPISIAPGELGA